jgi:hypothetical protein
MTRHRKTDPTGRSAGTLKIGRAKKWKLQTPFIGHSLELRRSVAFRSLSSPARKAMDFLEIEHLSHACSQNGGLVAPHRQLALAGISKRDVANALRELEAFGIIRCTERGARLGGVDTPSRYALTFYPTLDGEFPTEDWRCVDEQTVEGFQRERALRRAHIRARRNEKKGQ